MTAVKDKLGSWVYGGTKTDGRAHLYDNVKFLLITLVVAGHFIDDLTETKPLTQPEELNDLLKGIFIFIYSFHMPAFLFISGLFTKKHGDKLNLQPVVNFVMLGLLLKITVGFTQMLFLDDQTDGYFSLLSGDGVFWYLFVLAAYRLITYALKNAKEYVVMLFSIALALMVGYDDETNEWLSLSRLVVFFPFYYAGFCLDPAKVQRFCKRWYVRLLSAAGAALWFYFCFWQFDEVKHFRRLFTGKNPYSVVQLPNTEFWDRAFAMLISAGLIAALLSLTPAIVLPFITKLGSRTLQVYFWHRSLIHYFHYTEILDDYIMVKLPNSWWIAILLISVGMTFLLSADIFGRPLKAFMSALSSKSAKAQPKCDVPQKQQI